VQGQLNLGLDSARHLEYLRSIKQFSEFMDRFNQDSYDVPGLDPDRSLVLDRRQSILLLFDRNDPRFDRTSPEYSQEYLDQVVKFADDVAENNIYLDKHSDRIKAVVTTSVTYHGSPDTIRIILTQEVDTPNLVRWVISGVEADFLEIPRRDTTQVRFLSPVSHELGFMDLAKAFREAGHAGDYTIKDFEYDPLSVFLYGIYLEDFVFKQVMDVRYEIIISDLYCLTLSWVYSGGVYSGWMITDLAH
jgi:hypothetical protein